MFADAIGDDPQIVGGAPLDAGDLAHPCSVRRLHPAALELPRIEVPVGQRQRVRLGDGHEPSDESPGGVDPIDPRQLQDHVLALTPHPLDAPLEPRVPVGIQQDTAEERVKARRLVCQRPPLEVAAEAVSPDDRADRDQPRAASLGPRLAGLGPVGPPCPRAVAHARLDLLVHAGAGQEVLDRVRWLRALLQPGGRLVLLDVDRRRLGERVVVPDDLDEPAVARRARIGYDHAVRGSPRRPCSPQPDMDRHPGSPPFLSLPSRPLRSRIIFFTWAYCFKSRFTSCTAVPLPRAIRVRRLPLMIGGLRRSSRVIESMIASNRRRSVCSPPRSVGARRSALPKGSIPRSWSSGPMPRSCRSCSRKSSSENVSSRIFRTSSSAFSAATVSWARSPSDSTSPM